MMIALWVASLSRWALAAAYVVSIAAIAWVMHLRPPPPVAPKASKALAENREITLADLKTEATSALVGKYLVRAIPAGEPIPADAVSDKPTKAKAAPSKPRKKRRTRRSTH